MKKPQHDYIMILQSLNALYHRLRSIDKPGFAPLPVSWIAIINQNAQLQSLAPLQMPASKGTKLVPTPLSAPTVGKRASGNKPGFLADKTDYTLGCSIESATSDLAKAKAITRFELFRDQHLEAREKINHPDFELVCKFLQSWDPSIPDLTQQLSKAANAPYEELAGKNVAFQISGQNGLVHQLPAAIDYWSDKSAQNDQSVEGFCLVTGKKAPLARLHNPAIKGVAGGQAAGGSLVSFNLSAFISHEKEQGINAPVGETAAFAYGTALNWLIKNRRFRVGETTTVFWTDQPTEAEEILPWMISGVPESEDEPTKKRVQGILEKISRGVLDPNEMGDSKVPYYILGLSPNAARLSVRFWHTGTLGELFDNLKKHFADLSIIRQWDETNSKKPEPTAPSIYQLLRQTARDADGVSPLLAGALMRSILLGTRYPDTLINGVMNRIRVVEKKPKGEGSLDNVSYLRAAILKAWLIRNHHQPIQPMLDKTNTNPGYRLGRLFAILEKTQQDALPGINSTIRERFYSSASATPRSVFGRLLRTYQHHLAKLEPRLKGYHEMNAQEILSEVSDFPAHFNLQNQAQFALGYYHQRKALFSKKEATPEPKIEAL